MAEISKPVRQFAAVALALAALGAGYTLVAEPVIGHILSARERIAEQQVLRGRLEAAAGRLPEAVTLQREAAARPVGPLLLKGETEAIQLANLQALVGELAAAQGARLTGARPLPASDKDGVRLVGLRFDLVADLATLQKLLHRLEAMEPLLVVQALQIRAGPTGNVPVEERHGALDAGISVYGVQPPKKG